LILYSCLSTYIYTVVEALLLERLHTIFALFRQTYDLVQSLNVALESFISFLTKHCKN